MRYNWDLSVKIERDKIVPLMFMFMLIKTIIQTALNESVGNTVSKVIIYSIEFIFILLIMNDVILNITPKAIAVICVMLVLMTFGALMSESDNSYYYSIILDFLLKCVPMYFVGKVIATYEYANYFFKFMPLIASFAYMVIFFRGTYLLNRDTRYSQELGYALLCASIIAFYYFIRGRAHFLIYVIITLVGIISSGARGPFFCAVFAYAIIMLYVLDIRKIRNLIAFITVVVSLTLIYIEKTRIINYLTNLVRRNGLSSRFFEVLRARTMFQSRGRSSIWYGTLEEILKHHVIGTGVFRDRQFIYAHATRTDRMNSIHFPYEHNIFLEWLLQYGIIIGGIMSVVLVVLLVKMYMKCRYSDKYEIAIALIGIGFFPLLISGSYLESEFFYLLLGYAVVTCYGGIARRRIPDSARNEVKQNESDMPYNHSA